MGHRTLVSIERQCRQIEKIEKEGTMGKINLTKKDGGVFMNFDAAYRSVINKLMRRGENIINVKPTNKNRYIIIKTNKKNYLVTYKRELFMTFGRKFRSLGYKGVGDTINNLQIKEAMSENVSEIITVFPDGHTYYIPIIEFLNNSIRWIQKEGTEVRSISIHFYRRLKDIGEKNESRQSI